MPLTTAQLEEQMTLEREAISLGFKKLNDQTLKLENQNYASASIYGITSIEQLIPKLVERIEETNHRIHEGHYGKNFREIEYYLRGVEPLAAAAIACKLTFDKVFGYKDGCNLITRVCESISCK